MRLGLALALAWLAGCGEPARPQRLVLLTLDTLRFDRLDAEHMPRTGAFLARGLSFERFYASSSTTQPSHASLFTGLHPWQHGVVRNGAVLAEERATLAERLREHGFETAAVVASFPLDPRFGFAQGFDHFDAEFERSLGLRSWHGNPVDQRRFYRLGNHVTLAALRALDEMTAPKQFLWVHYFDPHDPYGDRTREAIPLPRLWELARSRDPKLPRTLARSVALYDADIAALDASLAPLFARLDADAERYETHVVVTSDHGESFGDHGSLGHGYRLTDVELRVPLVIVSPAVEAGVRSDTAGSVDLPATLFGLAGLGEWPAGGRDLIGDATQEGSAFGMRNLFDPFSIDRRTNGQLVTVATPWFYAVVGEQIWTGDTRAIVAEDGALPQPEQGPPAHLGPLFQHFQETLDGTPVADELDEETRAALRALGYAPRPARGATGPRSGTPSAAPLGPGRSIARSQASS